LLVISGTAFPGIVHTHSNRTVSLTLTQKSNTKQKTEKMT